MAETTAVIQGNGTDTTFQLLIKLVEKMGEMSGTLRGIDSGLTEFRTSTASQLANLQERAGRGEALNEVQNTKIVQLEHDRDALRREIAEMKTAHANDLRDLKEQQREDDRTRWMVRGGLILLSFVAPALWQYVIIPLLAR